MSSFTAIITLALACIFGLAQVAVTPFLIWPLHLLHAILGRWLLYDCKKNYGR